MKNRRYFGISVFAVSALLGVLTGCTEPGHYGTTSQPGYANQIISSPASGGATATPSYSSGGYSSSQPMSQADQELVSRLQQQLRSGSVVGFSPNVNVAAQNGVVTLSGSVPNEQARQSIDNVVSRTSGVVSVQDRMQVASLPSGDSNSASSAQTYSTPPSSAPSYSASGAQSYTTTPSAVGTSTPTGDIFNLHVQGLNETDRNLAQRILEGLRTDTTLRALLPTVDINVANGRVVLQGTVQSEQQRQAIASVVQRATGVNDVDNRLVVSGTANQ